MSKLKAIFAVSVLSVMCGFAMAQPAGGPDGSGGPGGRPQMTPPDGGPDGPCEPQACEGGMESEFYKAVNATEEQIEKLKAVFRTQMEKMKSWREANKEKFQAARKSMQEARESKDKDAISKAKEQMKALGEEGKKIHEQFIKDLSAVLDDTQMTKAKEFFKSKMDNRHMRGERDKGDRGGMLEQLGLTDDQKAKIKAIMEEARTKADAAENSEEKREIMESARKKINDEVLTDEQKAKLEKMKPEKGQSRPGEYLAAMNPLEGIATPEQMEQA
ncbi:MAG TPA: Spy/CpxP family protein refolding chaperone, partial [Phycisphaerae bacterium]|nr:Spy/CpxP family protein refolding chaperone [Phycisphaerae bacterium]